MFHPQPSAEQIAYRRATSYRETSVFLALGGGIILLAHGIDLHHAGCANWPALVIRVIWTSLLLGEALLLRRAPHKVLLTGAGVLILASALLDVLLLHVTGRSASPLLPFTYVLAMIMPLVSFDLLEVGIAGSGLLLAGTWQMLSADRAPAATLTAFFNAGGGALLSGWLLARAFVRARLTDEKRHLDLTAALRENEQLLGDLREALANVKTLRGLIPICAWCHKVRDDSGYWRQLEAYLTAHSDAELTHGMCPDCYQARIREGSGRA